MRWFPTSFGAKYNTGGKITVAAMLSVALVVITAFGSYFELSVQSVGATAVATSVTVLNTPPAWTVTAQEATASATSTPTNAGYTLVWNAIATDSSNDNYWLLICSASSTPTPHIGAAPTCGAGIQWAVSPVTTSGSQAIAATTTIATAPFNNENNPWYAYVCDGNSTGPACNPVMSQGGPGGTASPFVMDHPPTFTSVSNSGSVYPGGAETWSAVASTTDVLRGTDSIRMWICKTNVFNGATSSNPCAGGTWATSTLSQTNPSTSTVIAIPTQDANYAGYVFIANNFGLVATSTYQGYNSWFTVNAATPTIAAATISVAGGGPIVLTAPNATSGPYTVTVVVNDNNSCLSASSTNEVSSLISNIYLSSVTQANCKNASGQFNSNNCYPYADPQSQITCTQTTVGGSCNAGVTTINFSCTVPLWFNADPTDSVSPYSGQSWLASAMATNWKGGTSTLVESSTGAQLTSFLAFAMATTSVSYGGLQPGQSNATLSTTTDMQEQGNTGLDESLYGSTMCTAIGSGGLWNYPTNPNPDQCDQGGVNAGTKIPVTNQEVGTSSAAYGSGQPTPAFALPASTTPLLLGIHVPKTTATSSINNRSTYWGILVPSAITQAGNYFGQNTVTALVSSSTNW